MADEQRIEAYLRRDESLIGRLVNQVADGWRTLTGQTPSWILAADQSAEVEAVKIDREGQQALESQQLAWAIEDDDAAFDLRKQEIEEALDPEWFGHTQDPLAPVVSRGRDTGR